MRFKTLAVLLVLSITLACSVDQILADIDFALRTADALSAAVGNVSTSDAAAISRVTAIGSNGLSAVRAAYQTYKSTGASGDWQKLQAASNAVKVNLNQELAAAQISNPKVVDKVTRWVSFIVAAVDDIVGAVVTKTTATPGQIKAEVKSSKSLPTRKELKRRWDTGVCQGDTVCAALAK